MLKKLLLIFFLGFISSVYGADKVILVYGDSLSAGYGISIEKGWVSLLQQRLEYQGYRYKVVNASITGDTSNGASARLDKILAEVDPIITIVELGGNDGLRGIPPVEMKKNLGEIISRLKDNGSEVLLVPMMIPPNFGPVYTERFMTVYKALAKENQVTYGEFILADVALNPALMQRDGIHANEEGQPLMLENIWSDLKLLIDEHESEI
jgi:acyl-CoA thioesterase-1